MVKIAQEEYILSAVIIFGSLILARILHFILSVYIHKLVKKTKNTLDDDLLLILTRPFYTLVISIGVQISLNLLTELAPYTLYVNKAFFVWYVLVASTVISKVFRTLMKHWLHFKGKYDSTPKLTSNVLSVIVYIIGILIILDYFNIKITPLIATLGIGGLAIGLALQNTLANLFGGIHILSDKPLNVGDFVEIGTDLKGYVEDIGWRTTRIRKLSNNYVIVPNSHLADSIVVNYSLPNLETSCIIECGVDYGEDLDRVEKVVLAVANNIQENVEGTIKGYEPKVRFNEFGDSNINFKVILRVKRYVDRFKVRSEFIKALKKEFDRRKIEISWPVVKIVRV